MLKRILAFALAACAVYGRAPYEVKSPYLMNPSLNIEYIRKQADFFIQARDTVNGGFYSYIDRWGHRKGDLKGFLSASMLGYAFSKAFMVTGDESYLAYARESLQFLFDHGWDPSTGGWYYFSEADGTIPSDDPTGTGFNAVRYGFVQHWALLGIAAIYEAAGESYDRLMTGENWLDEHMWDGREGLEGYYEKTQLDGTTPSGKGYIPTVEGIPTHIIPAFLLTREDRFKTRLSNLGDQIVYRFIGVMKDSNVKFGFPQYYNADWIRSSYSGGEVGHLLKTALSLALIDGMLPDAGYEESARPLMLDIWNKGYDHVNGGPYTTFSWQTGEIEKGYKDYWSLDQAVYCGLAYYASTEEDSLKDIGLQMADESLDFFMNHLVDPVYGGSYSSVSRDGSMVINNEKGNGGKAGYHEIELAYAAYLYGSLVKNRQPVSLYYSFKSEEQTRDVRLFPLALKDTDLVITEVTLDGAPFLDFNSKTRTLTLAAGVGGKFMVTYRYTRTGLVEERGEQSPSGFELYQNYPNPFNPVTTIAFSLVRPSHVDLRVYDSLGKEVAVILSRILDGGFHECPFDGNGLKNGVYVYRLEAENFTQARKFVLIK